MYHGPGLHQWVMGLVFGPSPACPSHTWDRLFTAPCGTVLNRFVPPLVALPVPTLTLTLTLTLVTYTYGLVLYVCSVQWLLRFGPCLLFCVAAALLYARVKQACPACNRPIAPTTSSGHGTRSGFILHAASEREPRACPSHTRLVHPFAQQKEELTAATQYRLNKVGHEPGDLVPPRFILFRLFGQGWKLLTSYGGRGV